ncbi:tetratricopeptide repeat protein [Massilibacteroides sp.]|uniref:tetratricopeptide repeat protein n=1 Tax=Massilibacteroides sp. TaxID=2034766 RepID=UPI00261A2A3D|nr:tetratricopeptide repeat protein [Massilibacteroides sp.]MDD4516553.1 tetratricopeptide repeat protein [Massilibacteroides sp.]
MKKILISLCVVIGSHTAYGQRNHQYEAADRLFIEGKELFSLKNYAGCIDKLQAFKTTATDADLIQEADFMLVASAFAQGRANTDLLLKEFLDNYPDTRHQSIINFMIASVHFDRGEYDKAVFWFGESDIDLLNPDQQEAYSFRLAYSLLQTGEKDKARSYFTRIQQIGKTYRTASSYYVAYLDYIDGNYDKALSEFSKLKEKKEFGVLSQYYITQIYFIQNKFDRVTKEGESLLQSYPNEANNNEVHRIVGNSYYRLGNQNKATEHLSKYVSMTDSPLRGDLYILGVCYYNQKNYNSAADMLGRVVTKSDELTQNAYLYLGQCYLKLNDKNNARMSFEAAATANFDKQVREVALYNYALLLHETSFSGFGESVTVFEDFLNDFPNSKYNDRVNDYLTEVYLTTKNYKAALTSIDKINRPGTKILEAKQNVLFQLGTEAFTNMNLDEAEDYLSKAIALGTYNQEARSDAYFWRGETSYRKGNYAKAAADYNTYLNSTRLRNTDMYALAYYNLGYSYFKQNLYHEALSRFRQYVDIESNQQAASYADAYNRIGDCLFNNRQFSDAESAYARASHLQPSSGDYAVYQRGFLLGLQKDYRGKINAMDRLIGDYPQSQYVDDALFEKGRAFVMLEESKGAADAFNTLISQFPQSSLARKAGVQLALLYYNDNQLEKAAEEYKKVIEIYPGSDEAKVAMQDLKSVYVDLNDVSSYANYINSRGGNARFEISEQDSLTYIAAEKLFMRGDNTGAKRSLENYLQSFPEGAFSTNANYYLGSIAFSHKEYDQAIRLFEKVLDSGELKFREEALARKAEIEYMNKDYSESLESFKTLLVIAENPENIVAAKLGLMRSAQYSNQPLEALQAANQLLEDPKLSPEVQIEARYIRAKAYISQKQEKKALADLQVLSKDTRTVQGAEAKYLLAQLYFNDNQGDKAEKELMNFIENGTPHQYWLARGFILLADIYISKEDDFQARQYLTSLQNNYKGQDDISDMIEDRLGKLKK